jgi:LytS/YehU family sensor histidine kinase
LLLETNIVDQSDWTQFRNQYYNNLNPRYFIWYLEQAGALFVIFLVSGLFAFVEKRFKEIIIRSRLEKEKLQAELRLLKSQVNPHFLFNTLNNIYTLAYIKSDNAAPMVEKLSELMRYILAECSAPRVKLHREIAFLENYIELQSLKKSDAYNIDFYTEGIRQKHKIAPLILINFIENAFKHSDIETNPAGWIQASCVVSEKGELHFMIENSKREISNKTGIGFGLEGTQKILELNYPNQYELTAATQDQSFKIDLKIWIM